MLRNPQNTALPAHKCQLVIPTVTYHATARGKLVVFASRPTRKRVGGKRKAPQSEAVSYEKLMIAWDDVFESLCQDQQYAPHMVQLAEDGFQKYGPGFLFVRPQVVGAFWEKGRTSRKGFGSARQAQLAGTPLLTNADLLLLDCKTDYVPGLLLKTMNYFPDEAGTPPPEAAQATRLIQPELKLPRLRVVSDDTANEGAEASVSNSTAEEASSTNPPGPTSTSTPHNLDAASLDHLRRVMRGQDQTRLLTLCGLAGEDTDVGGEQPYDAAAGQVVVLLAAKIDGQPAVGADPVQAVREEDGRMVLTMLGMQNLAFA